MRIGLLIQDLKSEYSKLIIKGTQKYCLENGIQLFVFITRAKNWNNDVYEYQHIACKELASAENVDGIILVTSTYCQNVPEEEHQSLVDELNILENLKERNKAAPPSKINSIINDKGYSFPSG